MQSDSTPSTSRYAKGKHCCDCGVPVSTSSTGRCKKCARRNRPRIHPVATCVDCGKTPLSNPHSKRCKLCSPKDQFIRQGTAEIFARYRAKLKEEAAPPPSCIECGKSVSRRSTGRCHSCAQSEKWKRSAYRERAFEARRKAADARKELRSPPPQGVRPHPVGTVVIRKTKGLQYAFIKIAEGTGNADWQQHHRWVIEQRLGRKLGPKEHIHHIDGNGLNNSLENLAVISAKDHTLIMKLLVCMDEALAVTVARTLIARFPGIADL